MRILTVFVICLSLLQSCSVQHEAEAKLGPSQDSALQDMLQDKPQDKPQEKPKPKSGRESLLEKLAATFKKENIEVDRKKKTVTIPVVVNQPTNDLEFLLIHRIGKRHEALLVTRSKPSIINSAFILLGLKPGENVTFKKKDPAPTEKELKNGADPFVLVEPKGPQIYMTVSFQKGEKTVEMPLEEILLDWTANLSVMNNKWIYLGGRMAQMYRGEPEVFMADYEGNLISTCYKYPKNHLFTLDHERARDEMNWAPNPQVCPPPGTEMKLTFHVTKPDIVKKREERMRKLVRDRKLKGEKADTKGRPVRNPPDGGGRAEPPPKKGGDGKKKGDTRGKDQD